MNTQTKTPIIIKYETRGQSQWNTYQEALVADAIEQSGSYFECYKIEAIVKLLCERFDITHKEPSQALEQDFYEEGQNAFDALGESA